MKWPEDAVVAFVEPSTGREIATPIVIRAAYRRFRSGDPERAEDSLEEVERLEPEDSLGFRWQPLN